MRLSELLSSSGLDSSDIPDIEVSSISCDSRNIESGSVFFGLSGSSVDGSSFVDEAISGGSVAIVVGEDSSLSSDSISVPIIRTKNPRRVLSLFSSHFFLSQPSCVVGVTGTSGKTSVASFLDQIWRHSDISSAMIGTMGVRVLGSDRESSLTTPDPISLHRLLDQFTTEGITHCVMEASSHGLAQHRLDGVNFSACGFTNLGRDHLDYHGTMESYISAKLRLFEELLPPGSPAIIFSDDEWSEVFIDSAIRSNLDVRTVGRSGDWLRLIDTYGSPRGSNLLACIEHTGVRRNLEFPLFGDFQLHNALISASLALSVDLDSEAVFSALEHLTGVTGRLEFVGESRSGGRCYVDYAHKPEALEHILTVLRDSAVRLVVVFGCGGDRDKGKRSIMGEVADRLADIVIVTDDNPRSEDAAIIRKEIRSSAPDSIEIADRGEAIRVGISLLESGDYLVVAGKGHERGQIVGDEVLPFSDIDEVRRILELDK